MRKQQMLETLLETYQITVSTGDHNSLMKWSEDVRLALEGAGMDKECKIWDKAKEGTRFYISERGGFDSTFVSHMESMRGILQGFLSKAEQAELAEDLFPMDIFDETKPYIQKLASQANGCYRNGWYDGCAVMLRRLLEIMIIDSFVKYDLEQEIKDDNNNYFGLEKLIASFRAETIWHIPRISQKYINELDNLKELGDSAAHGRNITPFARIEKLRNAISYSFPTLIEIAYSK